MPPLDVAQQHAEQVVQHLIASSTLPEGLTIKADVFHISAGKGLVSASRYCRHIVVVPAGSPGPMRISWVRSPSNSSTSRNATSPLCTDSRLSAFTRDIGSMKEQMPLH